MALDLTVSPLSYALGAAVTGLDIRRALQPDEVAQLRDAWLQHLVVVFPAVELTLEQQVRFSRYFGELEIHPVPSLRHAQYPEVFEVTNRKINGRPSETGEIGRKWHSDGAFTVRPPTASLLHCRAIPRAGGSTWFNNMYMAYETLSLTMKKTIEQLEVVNDLFGPHATPAYRFTSDERKAEEDRKQVPGVIQPVVRVHPETGRKALYLNPTVTRHILGMSVEESDSILQFLYRHSVKPEFVYSHHWGVNDLVMWDNRCAMHLAPADYARDEIRQMYRTTLTGEPHGRLLQ